MVLLGGLLAPAYASNAAPALTLRDDAPQVTAWPAVQVYADASKNLTIDDVLDTPPAFATPAPGGSLGVRPDAIWLRIPLEVSHESNGRWVLDFNHPDLHSIQIYLTQNRNIVLRSTLGATIPYAERPAPTRSHALELAMQPGQSYVVYARIQTTGALILPITLVKPKVFLRTAVDEQMLQGVLTGLALCLIVYSLTQWFSLREPLFAQYALMTTGSLLYSLHIFGVGRQYLWTNSLWFAEHAAGLSALMAATGSFLFISQALVGHDSRSPLLRFMRGGAVLCVLIGIAYGLDVLNTRAIVIIMSILGPVPALLGIPGAVRRMLDGDGVGSSLLLAWLLYFVATAIIIGVINGWVPVNFWTQHSFQFGATIDMVLFMRVLALRTKALHTAAVDAGRERDAMHSLAHTDPLTGLPNRRGLNMALSAALPRCAPDKLLAVYMMDLDGFKPVNDQHGHDVGDELLVAVTRRLRGHLRQSDIVARLGGDEFVVMTGQLSNPEQAHELGLKLLDAFRAPFSLGDLQVEVGLTIGYAIAPNDSNDAVGLLKLADAAMYSGKQSGKFCLRRNTGDLALSSA